MLLLSLKWILPSPHIPIDSLFSPIIFVPEKSSVEKPTQKSFALLSD
jgi:hypothetical protein